MPPTPPTVDANGSIANPPNPGAKAQSPATDLANHPKGSLEKAPPVVGPPGASEIFDVIEEVPHTDGTTSVGIYTPATGISVDQLAASLRSAGHSRVAVHRRPASTTGSTLQAAAVNPNECTLGSATSLAVGNPFCPMPNFWQNEGFANPHVRFNDHTGSAWPVNTAVFDWNTANGINSYYAFNSCPFQAGARCVDIFEINNSGVSWVGFTFYNYNTSSHAYIDNSMHIEVNDFYPFSANPPRKTIEHEMGHALGLGHESNTSSVMYFIPAQGGLSTGGPNDFTFLANLYSIGR